MKAALREGGLLLDVIPFQLSKLKDMISIHNLGEKSITC
jgi:hypothetical protein